MNRWARRRRLSVSVLLRSARRFLEIGASETRRPHEEKRERHHKPEKDDHPRAPTVTASGGLRWSWKAVGETFRVGASRLGISQQVKQSIHGRLMAENALAGVVTPSSAFFGHFSNLLRRRRCNFAEWLKVVAYGLRGLKPLHGKFPMSGGSLEKLVQLVQM